MYVCMVLNNKICCSAAFQVYKVAREVKPTLSTLALALLLLSPQVYVCMFNLPYLVCVQGFHQKFRKVVALHKSSSRSLLDV